MFRSSPFLVRRLLSAFSALTAGIGLFGAWALSSPIGSSADETFHLTAVWCGDQIGGEFCTHDSDDTFARIQRQKEFLVPAYVADGLSCIGGHVGISAACQLKKDADQKESIYLNETLLGYGANPGLFYELGQRFVSADTESSVIQIRITNGMLAVILLLVTLSIQRLINHQTRLGYAVLAGLTPPFMFLVPSVNPTSWMFVGVPIAALGFRNCLDQRISIPLRLASTILALVAGLLAAGAKPETSLWLVTIASCLLATNALREKLSTSKYLSVRERRNLFPMGIVVALVFIATSPWTIGRHVAFGEPIEGPNRTWWRILANNLLTLPDFLIGFVGGGTWNVAAHQRFVVPLLAILCSLVVIIFTIFFLYRGADRETRFASILILSGGILWTLSIHQANSYYIGKIVQPRYLFPLFLAALLILGQRSSAFFSTRLSVAMVGIGSIGHSVLLYQHLRRYVVGLREWVNDDLGCVACELTPSEWWWSGLPSPTFVWIVGSLCFAVFGWLITTPPKPEIIPLRMSRVES